MRQFLKRTIEVSIARSGLGRLGLALSSKNVVVLSYHNIVPDQNPPFGDSSLHLPLSRFRDHLDVLQSTHSVVSFGELFRGSLAEGKRYAVVTFDDAYRGAMTLGLQELAIRGLPGTVFVCPGLLGCGGFWWDHLAGPDSGGVPGPDRDRCLFQLAGRRDAVMAEFGISEDREGSWPDLYLPVTEEEVLEAISRFPAIDFESHTWSHVHLPSVPLEEGARELRRPLEWLRERGQGNLGLLSFPYGATDGNVADLARETGYDMGFLVSGGRVDWSKAHEAPFDVPRMNIPSGLSREGFLAQVGEVWVR